MLYCRFSFCQYPFILSIKAKRTILQRDSEQQMVHMARVSIQQTDIFTVGSMLSLLV